MVNELNTEHIAPGELADYYEARLPAAREGEIEEHLAACEECTLKAREVHAFSSLWEQWTAEAHGEACLRGLLAKALELNPHLAEAWTEAANVLREWGRNEEALACYDRALELDPRYAEAWFSKGTALLNAFEDYREALVCFESAQRFGNPDASQAITLCRQRLGQQ